MCVFLMRFRISAKARLCQQISAFVRLRAGCDKEPAADKRLGVQCNKWKNAPVPISITP